MPPLGPSELGKLFKTQPSFFEDVAISEVIPECIIRLDNLRGNQRNSDLVVVGFDLSGPVLVTVEAKADEQFGLVIGEYVQRARDKNPRSMVPKRVERLRELVFPGGLKDEEFNQLRYQLLHAVAGTLMEARRRKANVAVFVVHEFLSADTNEELVKRNTDDLRKFVAATSGDPVFIGRLAGPFSFPGLNSHEIILFVGKITTKIS